MIYDLHTHTTHSDGVLIPAESARRAKSAGYLGIAITDHADRSNLEELIKQNLRFKKSHNELDDFKIVVGVELTHVNPKDIVSITRDARSLGADIVLVHGETMMEPVMEGTNRAAIDARVDILAHPGFITLEDAKLAEVNGVALEVTTRRGHSNTNAHVIKMAKKVNARLVINNDAHTPSDYIGYDMAKKFMLGLALSEDEIAEIIAENEKIFMNALNRNKR